MSTRALPVLVALVGLAAAHPGLPQAPDPPGARLLEHAMELLAEGNDADALEELEMLATRFPESDLADDALLWMLVIRTRGSELQPATALADRLEAEHGDSPAVGAARVLVADLRLRSGSFSPSELVSLRSELGRLLRLWPETDDLPVDWRAAVHVVSGEISLRLDEVATARGWFAGALDLDRSEAWRARGLVGMARCFLRQEEWRAALRLLQEVSEGSWRLAPPFPDPRRDATELVALLYRHRIRPAVQSPRWLDARRIDRAGQALDDPIGVAVAPSGRILLTDEGSSSVALLEADGTVVASQTLPGKSHPWFDPLGNAYIGTGPGVVDPVLRSRFSFQGQRPGERIEKIVAGARNGGGQWILAHDDGDRVSLFDPAGAFLRTLYEPRDGEVVDLALDTRGRVLVLQEDANIVVRISADGSRDTIASGSWDRPVALAVDGLDHIYVLDRDRRHVQVLDPDGNRLETVGPNLPNGGPSLDDPRDLAVAPGGELLLVDRDLATLIILR